jgi:hypothetical protein
MTALGLTPEQLAERRLRLHAGDAAAIMAGDYRKVYRRIKGLDPDDDLSGEFRVQLGSFTEPFNLFWTMRQTGRRIDYYSANRLMAMCWDTLLDGDGLGGTYAFTNELVVCRRHPFMACNLDGMTTTPQGHDSVIDAKHVGRSGEAEILRYTPAGVWQATCAGTDWWGLSCIVGNKWEPPIFQEVDPLYQATMTVRATECWGFIERNEEPPGTEAAPVFAPKPQPRLRSITVPVEQDEVYEALVRQNNWLSEARKLIYAFVGTQAAATHHAIVREDIKKLVPEDVGEIVCGRYRFARSKVGAVTQSLKPMEKDDGDAEV